jgi:predicted O-methyltransferase YrrM
MEEIIQYAKENFVPIVRPKTLELLLSTIRKNKTQKILEIGTAIGYSGSQMLLNSEATLTTIEKNEKMFEVSKNNFERLGLSSRVTQINGDAKEVLQQLVDNNERYDFIFLDGPKGQYLGYLPLLNELLKVNGIIFADDVLFRGLVQGNDWPRHRIRTLVLNLRKYLEEVQKPPFVSEIIDLEDGVCITTKGEE